MDDELVAATVELVGGAGVVLVESSVSADVVDDELVAATVELVGSEGVVLVESSAVLELVGATDVEVEVTTVVVGTRVVL